MARRTRTTKVTKTETPSRAARTKSRKQTTTSSTADVEVVEEAPGEGIDTGIAIATCLMLVAAILFLDAELGRYGAGVFF
jgi:hypothetical protein